MKISLASPEIFEIPAWADSATPMDVRVAALAEDMFDLQILGAQRAYDEKASIDRVIYCVYVDGSEVLDGASLPRRPSSAGADHEIYRFHRLFSQEIANGNNVIVWRRPIAIGVDGRVSVRCAFTSTARLRINQPKETPVATPSKEAQRGPNVNQHKRLAQGEKVGKVGEKGAPKLQAKSNPKGRK